LTPLTKILRTFLGEATDGLTVDVEVNDSGGRL